jgi:hypothetical protein
MAREGGGYTSFGARLADLEDAWKDRLLDAETLHAAGRNASTIAAGLYALEIRLKALICQRLDLPSLPKAFEFHDLSALLILSGLSRRLEKKLARSVKRNWDSIVVLSSSSLNDLRYLPDQRWGQQDASDFLNQLNGTSDGVLTWLSKQR